MAATIRSRKVSQKRLRSRKLESDRFIISVVMPGFWVSRVRRDGRDKA
jgi:hypothetical protein